MSRSDGVDSAAGLSRLREDLAEEHEALDELVAPLDEQEWSRGTPASGWSVRDQISHLQFFDEAARLALSDAEEFLRQARAMKTADIAGADRPDVALGRSVSGSELLERWRESRAALRQSLESVTDAMRVPWYGPAMSPASFVTARLMETWAHGQDVVDGLDASPIASERLRHVCDLGIRARPYAFRVNGRDDPSEPIRIEVHGPAGDPWIWGPDGAVDRIEGSALDLALIMTQRRHWLDTQLEVVGSVARQWVEIAQAFAGPAGPGRRPESSRSERP